MDILTFLIELAHTTPQQHQELTYLINMQPIEIQDAFLYSNSSLLKKALVKNNDDCFRNERTVAQIRY
ncbi:hypothetical protein [Aquicella lusitana]|uniref:Uncharacterized protein n=1 Tax=Aquicella lusitana TaxID=254246 RepID=A0A370GXS1_9COXI|nr:hypothetical protein [Aquicella lusitana]RDI48066.1 hypothetical protein C8D86_10331 [Aquicella lusitana]VVC72918.1 hypothetical protein AQULUS_06420 [Aquicella lusitana]